MATQHRSQYTARLVARAVMQPHPSHVLWNKQAESKQFPHFCLWSKCQAVNKPVTNIIQHNGEGAAESRHSGKRCRAPVSTAFPPLLRSPSLPFQKHPPLHHRTPSRHPAPAASSCLAEHRVSHCHASNAQVKPSDIYLPQSDGIRNRPPPKKTTKPKKNRGNNGWFAFFPKGCQVFKLPFVQHPQLANQKLTLGAIS